MLVYEVLLEEPCPIALDFLKPFCHFSLNNNNMPAFIHALWIADPSKRAKGLNAAKPSKEKQRKGDLNAVCDRQQARADPLLFTKRPASLKNTHIFLITSGKLQLKNVLFGRY